MKRSKVYNVCLLIMLLVIPAMPVLAEDEEDSIKIEVPFFRYRLSHIVESELRRGFFSIDGFTGASQEYLEGELDLGISIELSRYVNAQVELELDDNYMGDDNEPQPGGYNDVIKGYWLSWSPAALRDNFFWIKVGDFGSSFGRYVNNNDSPRGSLEVSWILKNILFGLGYGRTFEGETNDDVIGDGHLIRGHLHVPVSDSRFSIGAYGALYLDRDVLLQEASYVLNSDNELISTPVLTSDATIFSGAIECSATIHASEFYTEFGFTTGSMDLPSEDFNMAYTAGGNLILYSTDIVDVELSGFYALGGAKFDFKPFFVGIEAGFGNGDGNRSDISDGEITGYLGPYNSFSIDEIIEDELLLLYNGAAGLAGLTYLKVEAGVNPTERLYLSAAVIYEKPTEEFTSSVTAQQVDTFGIEFDTELSYQLTKHVNYVLTAAFAAIDDNWFEEDQFQVMNSIEFEF